VYHTLKFTVTLRGFVQFASLSYCIFSLVKHPDDGRRSDQNM